MADENLGERFIDAEEHFEEGKNSYEDLIIMQIKRCMDVLSKEETGGYVKNSKSKTGNVQEQYVEDVRAAIINSVGTLKSLLKNWTIKDREKNITNLIKQIAEYKKTLSERMIIVQGVGKVKVGNIQRFSVGHPLLQEYVQFQCQIFREIFEELICVYQEHKMEIASYETEGG